MATQAAAASSSTPIRKSRQNEDRFYGAMAAAVILTAVAGFAPSLLESSGRRAPVTPLVAVHGLLCLGWLILFAAQVALIAKRRIAVHRALGTASAALAVALMVVGYVTAIAMARRGSDLSGDLHVPPGNTADQLVFALGDLLTFAILLAAGYIYRRRAEVHKRLMLLATVGGLVPASLAHLIGHVPALNSLPGAIILLPMAVFFFAPAIFDRLSLGRFHPVSLWAAVGIFAWANLRAAVIGPSAAWHNLIGWLAR